MEDSYRDARFFLLLHEIPPRGPPAFSPRNFHCIFFRVFPGISTELSLRISLKWCCDLFLARFLLESKDFTWIIFHSSSPYCFHDFLKSFFFSGFLPEFLQELLEKYKNYKSSYQVFLKEFFMVFMQEFIPEFVAEVFSVSYPESRISLRNYREISSKGSPGKFLKVPRGLQISLHETPWNSLNLPDNSYDFLNGSWNPNQWHLSNALKPAETLWNLLELPKPFLITPEIPLKRPWSELLDTSHVASWGSLKYPWNALNIAWILLNIP